MVVTDGCRGFALCIRFIRCSDKNSSRWAAEKVRLMPACIPSIMTGARLRFLNTLPTSEALIRWLLWGEDDASFALQICFNCARSLT